jgi:hypothetical protein
MTGAYMPNSGIRVDVESSCDIQAGAAADIGTVVYSLEIDMPIREADADCIRSGPHGMHVDAVAADAAIGIVLQHSTAGCLQAM